MLPNLTGLSLIQHQFKTWLKTRPFSDNTLQSYEYIVSKFIQYLTTFEVYDLNSVNLSLLQRFAYIKRGGDAYAPKTTKLRLAVLNLFLAWCYNQRYVYDNLVIKKRKQELLPNYALKERLTTSEHVVILFPEEQKRLLAINNDLDTKSIRNSCIIALALATGLLGQELLTLKSDALDLTSGFVYLDNCLQPQRVKIPLNLTICATACTKWLKRRGELFPDGLRGYLFPTKKGDPLTMRALHKIIAQSLTKAEITKVTNGTKLLRQSAICNMLRQGKNFSEIRAATGIKSIGILMKYRDAIGATN